MATIDKTAQKPAVDPRLLADRMASAALRRAISLAAEPVSLVTVERGMDDLLSTSSLSSHLPQ